MKTLIVDDQYENKGKVIAGVLNKIGSSKIELVVDLKSATKKMMESKYDLLIIDLQIPEILGEDVLPNGGTQLLEYIELNDSIHKPTMVLGITSHQDSFNHSLSFFQKRGWSLILGVEDEEYIQSVLTTMSAHVSNLNNTFDIAFITALPHIEYEALMSLPLKWELHHEINDDNVYHKSILTQSDGSERTVIATCLSHMGIATAAAATASICVKFSPKLIVMTGICAGIEGRVNLGDILIADPSWDWGSGKLTFVDGNAKFLSQPTQIAIEPSIRRKIQHISSSNIYMNDIYSNWNETRPSYNPKVHIGPIATGAVVLEDPHTVELIKSQNRSTNGIEMEAFGVMTAAFNAGPNRPNVLIAKSVCDFANPEKNDDWQKYAAYTSSTFAYKFIVNDYKF
ncbi:TPA: hypothetical protein OUD13_000819 [Morganella morganii]|nr:hypothetical protein [Morganella morganii]